MSREDSPTGKSKPPVPPRGGDTLEGGAGGALSDEWLAENDGLLFRWKDRRKRGWAALLFFLFVAVIVHAIGFYLFQVTPPLSNRVEAEPARVTMLDPQDPAVASLLREVDDRLVFLRPASLVTSNLMRIEDYAVTFEPSFMQRQIDFQPPEAVEPAADPLPLVDPQIGLLIPPLSPQPVTPTVDGSARSWRIGGGLADRKLAEGSAERLDSAVREGLLPDGSAWMLTVDAEGRATRVESGAEMDAARSGEIVDFLRTGLRFAERADGAAVSGNLVIGREPSR